MHRYNTFSMSSSGMYSTTIPTKGRAQKHPDTAGGAAASHQLCKSPTDTGLPNQTSIDQSIDWEDKSTNKSMIVS